MVVRSLAGYGAYLHDAKMTPIKADYDGQVESSHLRIMLFIELETRYLHHSWNQVDKDMIADENVSQALIEHDDAVEHTEEMSTEKSPQADGQKKTHQVNFNFDLLHQEFYNLCSEVLNSIENDGELGTNWGTSNLASNGANSSGSSFWNVETSSTSTTPIVDQIGKLEKLIIKGKVTLVDDDSKPPKRLIIQVIMRVRMRDTYESGDYDEDPYDDDMYEGQDLPDKIQDICDNLDIRVRGRRKK
ncbi:hypothetical protein Tco_0820798 [Tanacetum coccineum]|uniref:Uncharacterized protein n=1 Tax=Tanacetum coccineum TaxID=301880 RepID=A0ABQ5AC55_9ASTR